MDLKTHFLNDMRGEGGACDVLMHRLIRVQVS